MLTSEVKPQKKPIKIKTKNTDNNFRVPAWVIGIIIGITLGIVTAWLDKTFLNNQSFSTGFIIALLSSLIGIAIDTRSLLEKRVENEDRRARLMKGLEDCPFAEEDLVNLLNNAERIKTKDENKYLHDRATEVIEKCRKELSEIADCQIKTNKYQFKTLIGFTSNAKKYLYATSTVADLKGLWKQDEGTKYLDEQINAIKRGVDIRRLFIITDTTWKDAPAVKSLCNIMQKQKDGEVKVRWLLDSLFEDGDNAFDYEDYVLIDDFVKMTTTTNPDNNVVGMTIDFKHNEVERKKNNFLKYWESGEESLDKLTTRMRPT